MVRRRNQPGEGSPSAEYQPCILRSGTIRAWDPGDRLAPRDPAHPNCTLVASSLLFQDKQLRIFDPRAKPEASQVSCVGRRAWLRPQWLHHEQAGAGSASWLTDSATPRAPGQGPLGGCGSPQRWAPALSEKHILGPGRVWL